MAGVIVIEISLVVTTIAITAGIVVLIALIAAFINMKNEDKEATGFGPALASTQTEEEMKDEEFMELLSRIGRYSGSVFLGRKFTKWFGEKVRQDLSLVSGEGTADMAYRLWTISANRPLREYLGPKGIRRCLGYADDDIDGIMEVCDILHESVMHVAERLRESLGTYEERKNMSETMFYSYELDRVPFECREAFVRPVNWINVSPENPVFPTDEGELILVTREKDMGCSFPSVACIYIGDKKPFAALFGQVLPVYWEGSGYYGITTSRSGEKNTEEEVLAVGSDGPVLRKLYDETDDIIAWSLLKPYLPEIFV